MRAKRVLPLVFVIVGLIVLTVGIVVGVRTAWFVHRAVPAEGKVVALESRRSTGVRTRRTRPSSSRTYVPIFEFKDASGAVHRVTETVGSRPAAFASGETVTVLYRPENPEQAHIKALSTLWLGTLILVPMGLGFTIVGLLIFRAARGSPVHS